jgi:DnaD/phage-associated family protein
VTATSFSGFPDSGLATTVHNLFFARVMPEIDRAEELVVSAYFFYASGQSARGRRPRFVTRRELAANAALLRSLASLCDGQDHEALDLGLRLAVQRRTLLRAEAEADGKREELFAVNTPSNRRALSALSGGSLELAEPLPPAVGVAAPGIFALYEENIGSITPLIAEELQDAEQRYPPEWLRYAFKEAVSVNKRSWRYVERILRRWETEGPDYEEPERDPRIEWLERRYREGKRRLSARS